MAEEKYMHKGGHLLFVLGILAIVYGVVQYLTTVQSWPSYGAWIVGGVILVIVAWAKKSMMKK